MKKLIALLALSLALQPMPAAAVGGPSNVVIAINRVDNNLVVRSNVQVQREPGVIAAPLNSATAFASCTDCQTIAVALQLNYGGTDAHLITPQNAASAINSSCTRCVTVAIAYQVFYTVDDPTQLPPGVLDLIQQFDATLRAVSTDPTMTPAKAIVAINAVVTQFQDTFTTLDVQTSNAGL